MKHPIPQLHLWTMKRKEPVMAEKHRCYKCKSRSTSVCGSELHLHLPRPLSISSASQKQWHAIKWRRARQNQLLVTRDISDVQVFSQQSDMRDLSFRRQWLIIIFWDDAIHFGRSLLHYKGSHHRGLPFSTTGCHWAISWGRWMHSTS